MSINKAQAVALAEGFLDDIGTDDKSSLIPRETFTELFLIAGELVEDCQTNLNRSGSNASGTLSKSLKLNEPKKSGSVVSVDMLMEFYGDFVNKGVKGTKSGIGKYQFRSPFPSTNMVKALEKSIKRARKSTRNTNRHKTTSTNELKNVRISDVQKAYGAGRNIKMYGIKATGFLDKAVASAKRKISERLGAALKIDIINSI